MSNINVSFYYWPKNLSFPTSPPLIVISRSEIPALFVTDFCAQSYEFHTIHPSTRLFFVVPVFLVVIIISTWSRLFIAIQSIAGILKIDIACKRSPRNDRLLFRPLIEKPTITNLPLKALFPPRQKAPDQKTLPRKMKKLGRPIYRFFIVSLSLCLVWSGGPPPDQVFFFLLFSPVCKLRKEVAIIIDYYHLNILCRRRGRLEWSGITGIGGNYNRMWNLFSDLSSSIIIFQPWLNSEQCPMSAGLCVFGKEYLRLIRKLQKEVPL